MPDLYNLVSKTGIFRFEKARDFSLDWLTKAPFNCIIFGNAIIIV